MLSQFPNTIHKNQKNLHNYACKINKNTFFAKKLLHYSYFWCILIECSQEIYTLANTSSQMNEHVFYIGGFYK